MRYNSLFCFALLLASMTLNAATHLSGDVGGKTFDPSGNPYIIDQDIVIAKNTQLVLKAGCIVLFKSFTGINVYGSMIVEGTSENVVVFTSINDANYNPEAVQLPNPFDWNGIYVAETSGDIKFRNFKLMYSVFGIKSKKDQVTIQSGYFKQNGQFHFTINDNIHYVQDNISYSYNVPESNGEAVKPQQESEPVKQKSSREKSGGNKKRRAAAVTLMSVGVASGVTAIVCGIVTSSFRNKTESAENQELFDTYQKKFNITRTITIITGISSGVCIPVSLFLFIKKDKSTMTKKVSLDFEMGNERTALGFTRYF